MHRKMGSSHNLVVYISSPGCTYQPQKIIYLYLFSLLILNFFFFFSLLFKKKMSKPRIIGELVIVAYKAVSNKEFQDKKIKL